MKQAAFGLASLLAIVPHMGAAQPVSGPYAGLSSGLAVREGDINDPVKTTPSPLAHSMQKNGSPALTGSVGEGFGNGFRMEVEGHAAR